MLDRRVEACVAACEGIETDALERLAPAGIRPLLDLASLASEAIATLEDCKRAVAILYGSGSPLHAQVVHVLGRAKGGRGVMLHEVTDRRERYLVHRDIPECLKIENASFPETSRWSAREFRLALSRENVFRWVVEDTRGVAGYCLVEHQRPHRHRPGKLLILNMAVAPDTRLHGLGRQLVRKFQQMVECDEQGRYSCVDALVRETNVGSQLFLRALGFLAIRTLRGVLIPCSNQDVYKFRYRP